MPTYTIEAPDGRRIKIQAADQQTAISGAQQWASANPRKKAGYLEGIANAFTGAVNKVGSDIKARQARDARDLKRPLLTQIADAPRKLVAEGLGDASTDAANVLNVVSAPLNKAALPLGRAYNAPIYALGGKRYKTSGLADIVTGNYRGPQPMSREEADESATADILTALSLAAPLKQGPVTFRGKPIVKTVGEGVGLADKASKVPVLGAAVRAVNKTTGGKMLNPTFQAKQRLMAALKADKASPEEIAVIVDDWERTGASSPSFLDAVSKLPTGGQGVLAEVRGAAMNSPVARGSVKQYRNDIEANIQDRAQDLTRDLTPDQRSVQQFTADTKAERAAKAKEQYGAAQSEVVPIDDDLRAMLSDEVGQEVLRNARYAAVVNRDAAKVAELDALMSGGAEAATAGTLDEVYQAFRDAGDTRLGNPSAPTYNTRAGIGLKKRAGDVDATLDSVEALKPARADYANRSAAIEAAEQGGSVLRAAPAEYADQAENIFNRARPVGDVPAENALSAMRQGQQVGARNALVDAIGNPTQGAQGVLNRVSSSNNVGENLASTFGNDKAQLYRQGIGNETARVQNARAIDPNFGSQTAVRQADAENAALDLVEGVANIKSGGLLGLLRKVRNGATLTQSEAEALVELALRQAGPDVLTPSTRTIVKSQPRLLAPEAIVPFSGNGSGAPSIPSYGRAAAAEGQDKRRPRKKRD